MIRFLILASLCLGLGVSPLRAADGGVRPLVVILLPGTSLSDWRSANAPALHRIMATGSLAVMNTRTARLPNDHKRESPESAALTLGAGSRAAGASEVTDSQQAARQAPGSLMTYGDFYERRTSVVPPTGALVNVHWPQVQRENSGQGYDLRPGNLGDALARQNIAVCIGGGRFAFPVACDGTGVAHPVATPEQLPHPFPSCLVWDAGPDLTRADALIGQAMSQIAAQHGRLIVASPFVNDQAYSRGERLAPIAAWGGHVPPGVLYSPSTHRAGLVTNTDFAPSVTALFGAQPERPWLPTAAFGHPWTFQARSNAVVFVANLEAGAYRQGRGMKVLPLVAIGLGFLLIVILICTEQGRSCPFARWGPGVVLFALLVSTSVAAWLLWIAALTVVYWQLQKRTGDTPLLFLSATLTVLVLTGDTLSGNPLMRSGLLGYSAVEGARYYGIGNEAMGALVGSALVTANILWRGHGRRPLIIVALLVLTLLLGLPTAGAKAGGLLVAVATFGAFLWTASGKSWNARVICSILGAMALVLALISLLDWHHAGGQSHLGGAIDRISSGGAGEAVDIIRRKLAVEIRLLYHSTWAIPLWLCLLGLYQRLKQQRLGKSRGDNALAYGGVAAMTTCLAANDAGVVAAALCGVVVLCGLNASHTENGPPPDNSVV